MSKYNLTRGMIVDITLGDGIGSEQKGRKPGVIISNDKGNDNSPNIIVAILTSQNKTKLPVHVITNEMPKVSTVMCEQIRTISKDRVNGVYRKASPELMELVNNALRVSLGL